MRKVLAVLGLVLISTDALACSCVRYSVAERLAKVEGAYTVKVVGTRRTSIVFADSTYPGTELTLKVVYPYKGSLTIGATFKANDLDDGGMCGIPVEIGTEVLIYRFAGALSDYGACNTRRGDRMAADLDELRKLLKRQQSGAGT